MNNYNPLLHHRHSIRLQGYDYSQEGLYFVTICVQNRINVFGKIVNGQMILNENNAMFSLKEGEDKAVLVHIWLEGTDPLCTDELKSAEYAIRLRFTGTDSSNQAFDH